MEEMQTGHAGRIPWPDMTKAAYIYIVKSGREDVCLACPMEILEKIQLIPKRKNRESIIQVIKIQDTVEAPEPLTK